MKKDWKKLNKESTPKGSTIFVKPTDGNYWVGIRKFPNGWQVATSFGLQPKPFKKKENAIRYMNEWMAKH